jgi:hypothetical protein
MFLSGMIAVVWQVRREIQLAELDSRIEPFPFPFWLFAYGLAFGALSTAVYFTRALMPRRLKAQRIGAAIGGLIWALGGMRGRWWIERDLGWWHSQIAGYPDPLMLFSRPLSFRTCAMFGSALVLVLFMIGRRFGRKGQAMVLTLLGLGLPLLERLWFGEFIPALKYAPLGMAPFLGSAGILIATGLIAILVMRLIGGPDAPSPECK